MIFYGAIAVAILISWIIVEKQEKSINEFYAKMK